jgi:hypothetical protein
MVIGGSVPASAKAPLKEVFTDEGWFTLPDIPCSGFTLTETMDSEAITVTTTVDETGDPIKIATRANFFGTITNTVSGHTFRDHASFTETVNVPEGTITVSGIGYHYRGRHGAGVRRGRSQDQRDRDRRGELPGRSERPHVGPRPTQPLRQHDITVPSDDDVRGDVPEARPRFV